MEQVHQNTEQRVRVGLNQGIIVDNEKSCVVINGEIEIPFDALLHLAWGIFETSKTLRPGSTTYEFFQSLRDAGVARNKDGSITVSLPFAGDTPS